MLTHHLRGSGARRSQQRAHVMSKTARVERLAGRDVGDEPAAHVDEPHDRGVRALRMAGDLRRGVPRSPNRCERPLRADQVAELRRLLLPSEPRAHRRGRVAARVDAHRDDRDAAGVRAELAQRVAQLRADQRADVRAVGVEERDEVRLAGERARVERAAVARVGQADVGGGPAAQAGRQRLRDLEPLRAAARRGRRATAGCAAAGQRRQRGRERARERGARGPGGSTSRPRGCGTLRQARPPDLPAARPRALRPARGSRRRARAARGSSPAPPATSSRSRCRRTTGRSRGCGTARAT